MVNEFRISVRNLCLNFPINLEKIEMGKNLEIASERFYFSLYQVIEAEKLWEEKYDQKKWADKQKLKIKNRLNKGASEETYRRKALGNNRLIEDYDEFKSKITELLNNRSYKDAGKIAEKHLSKYSSYKPYLTKLDESEHERIIFNKEENEEIYPKIKEEIIKITISPDYADERGKEFYEFKLTDKEEKLKNSLISGICQSVFYYALDYYLLSNLFEKASKNLRKYPINVEVYVVEKNRIFTFRIIMKHKNKIKLFEDICTKYKEEEKIDLIKLIKKGRYSLD